MRSIAFVDLEVQHSGTVAVYGCIKDTGATYHAKSADGLKKFIGGSEFLCGHNLLNHDIRYLRDIVQQCNFTLNRFIDTLYLSPLLFPHKPYHALLKDEKLITDELNNPLSDAIKAKDLFLDEVEAFQHFNEPMKRILYLLLKEQKEFCGFFNILDYHANDDLIGLINLVFSNDICQQADLPKLLVEHPIELAYCLTNIQVRDQFSILPAWVLKNYPGTERIMHLLRGNPCLTGCVYCNQALDPLKGLKYFFNYDTYRKFGGQPLQEIAVRDAVLGKSILAVFPTGGGKSITFQVPALMSGRNEKGLTIVISPLQSLMKDQVDNLERAGIAESVTINGMIDPIDRAKAIERVRDGSVSILYISPELLRSRTTESILLGRIISRFVIDEAHCFSAWGQDFRVDYLYIATFIKNLQEKKNLSEPIPVSCFTATAKPSVVEDIKHYFKIKLGLDLVIHQTNAPRTNLQYKVIIKKSDADKYQELRRLIEANRCPTIVYVSRTLATETLAETLTRDGFPAKPFHGQMNSRDKMENQNAFLAGEVSIMVATSAFGMGVDKKDVGLVIHYQISDSLEQYLQEAGRAGRDEHITADCYVLFNEEDLDKHFALLNQTRINMKEIQQIWKAIKELTKYKRTISQSALEIARKAGWDETISQIETRVTTAIAALEEAGYIRRTQNMPRVYADSILCRNVIEASEIINDSSELDDEQKEQAIRIMINLIGKRSRSKATDGEAESRVDYIADQLGLKKDQVIFILNILRQIGILADTKDLIAYLTRDDKESRSSQTLISFSAIERALLMCLEEEEETYNLKELNEQLENQGCINNSIEKIQTLLRYWQKKKIAHFQYLDSGKNFVRLAFREPLETLRKKQNNQLELASFIISYLFDLQDRRANSTIQEDCIIDFSVQEILKAYQDSQQLFKQDYTFSDVEDSIYYLSQIEALYIEGGFLVLYNPMTIQRLEEDPRKRFKKEDYQKLELHYEIKMQQIHIVGEYARRMVNDYKEALQFVDDYFQLNYSSFLDKYFKGSRRVEITRNIMPKKFRELFGELSLAQLKIISDNESQYIAVLAGPGSGKTRILVHKLASLILMEDVKFEQLLMLTFSRAAATEFKVRLTKLIHKAANFVDIKTFHSYCFDLLGKVGNIEKSDQVIADAIARIESGDVDPSQITKTVLVIDEAQDMSQNEFRLIETLMHKNDDMRVIAVGDDDQNIFEFRGSSSKYLKRFLDQKKATQYELLTNYRSKSNLVDFANQFVKRIPRRLKQDPIIAQNSNNGSIRIVRYNCNAESSLLTPFVDDLVNAERIGSTCVLVNTNDQAMQVTGMLQKCNVPAKLIQTNEGFNLVDLAEIRFFVNQLTIDPSVAIIDNEIWDQARQAIKNQYSRSSILANCLKLINDFAIIHPDKKYMTDFEMFIRESKLEDFVTGSVDTIYVGTMHKAKGKEYDNVYLLLEKKHMYKLGAEEYRLLYVALTRAKSNLVIHYDDNYFEQINTKNIVRRIDTKQYPMPNEVAMQTGHKDVYLDYFINEQRQRWVNKLQSGDSLSYKDGACQNDQGQVIIRFSKKFTTQIERAMASGFQPSYAKTGFISYWKKEGTEKEYLIVLPELHFSRKEEGN